MKRLIALAAGLALGMSSHYAHAADVSLDQANGQFSQTSETLAKGDTLVLLNKDNSPHDINVIDQDGDPTDLGVQAPGVSVKIKFDEPGFYKLRCTIAPAMHMSLTVN